MSGHWAPKIKKENIICFLNSYCSRKWNRISMGIINSKDLKKKINEATSNTSLSNLRYVITEKPKWKVFKKREVTAIPAYHTSLKPLRGCPCGNNSPCKQKVTPRGVTIHYPQKKKKFRTLAGKSFKSPKVDKGYLSTKFNVNLNVDLKRFIPKLPHLPKMPQMPHLPHMHMPRMPRLPRRKAKRSLSRDFMFMPFLFS
ncbi:uncharacterized protein LOC114366495 isoform X1 [Ostrinia furnacalis]|uniref:uncharacterized protein LOC114366495 isoform X1 n=1 Tax=Ostrinia furnacalis TaxID=93504 RepID=UPI001039427B|nr:uncharacterized protein LOC114366495 isoform X1 [Ostrinia furnacalis]